VSLANYRNFQQCSDSGRQDFPPTEPELACLILWIAMTNVWDRFKVATRQLAGEWAKPAGAQKLAGTSPA
jgi:hypothetical protein